MRGFGREEVGGEYSPGLWRNPALAGRVVATPGVDAFAAAGGLFAAAHVVVVVPWGAEVVLAGAAELVPARVLELVLVGVLELVLAGNEEVVSATRIVDIASTGILVQLPAGLKTVPAGVRVVVVPVLVLAALGVTEFAALDVKPEAVDSIAGGSTPESEAAGRRGPMGRAGAGIDGRGAAGRYSSGGFAP